jgi:Fis family transcriptional regulator
VGSNGSNHPAAARSLEEAVLQELERYFIDLEGVTASGVYAMVVRTVERPMLEVVLQKTGGNQLKAAEVLGINRNTLRKKIQHYGLTPGKLADTGAGT